MFIAAKRNYLVRRADGSLYGIKKGYIGDIPADVAKSPLVQRAIKSGKIAVPRGTKDQNLEEADNEAEKKSAKDDTRPDAAGKSKDSESQPPDGEKQKK